MKLKRIAGICVFSFMPMLFAAPPANIKLDSPLANPEAPSTVQAPSQIMVKKDNNKGVSSSSIVESKNTLQDAANHADRNLQTAVSMLKCGSGTGFLAKGEGFYTKHKNRNISLIAQRLAYVEALANARKNLLAYLENMSVEAKEVIQKEAIDIDNANDDVGTRSVSKDFNAESINTVVQGLLKGYSIFSVKDDGSKVSVSIVSSPLTRSGGIALSGGMMVSGNYQEAFNKFYAELKTGTLPPEGSKVFLIADGQGNYHPFFATFGSAIIRRGSNSTASQQQRLLALAENQAMARAAANLCRLLMGDHTSWNYGFIEMTERNETSAGMGKALKALSQDTLNQLHLNKEASDHLQNSFVNIVKSLDTFSSAAKGQIPAGVNRYKWTDDKGDWAYALMVYNPSLTQHVKAVKEQTYSGPQTSAPVTKPSGNEPIGRIGTVGGNPADF